jgi:energy-coupling factor transport system ATP-binding protein
MVRIELNSISFSYPGESAPLFADFDLTINAGEWLAVVGPSAAGKTTLLKLIKGLLHPHTGEVRVNGAVLPRGELNYLAACAFANPENQIVSTVVAEDVAFALENFGLASETIGIRVEEALKWVDLWERAGDYSHHLSGGEQQRLILAGVLAQRKECILLDDPLLMVGGRSRAELLDLLKRIHGDESPTLVHTTHLLEEAILAQRLVALERGEIVFDDTPHKFLQEKELMERLGLEKPAITELGEVFAESGLVKPSEIVSVEQFLEVLTILDRQKDNQTAGSER